MSKILMIISAADSVVLADGSAHPTGFWAEEVVASHQVLRDAGIDIDIATPGGKRPTVDAASLDESGGVSEADAETFRSYLAELEPQLNAPLVLADVKATEYDALYIPGGHGPMTDLVSDADLGRLLNEAVDNGVLVTALCHGLAGLLSATREDGSFTFKGRHLTAFTNEEEMIGGLKDASPYFVETRLQEAGAVTDLGAPFTSKVVVDGRLITGQNPQSSKDTATKLIEALA